MKNRFGSRDYAAEELIAELGAAVLCAEFGFDGDVRNAGYIANWIELLKADKRAFFTACSQASKAADYLRGLALAEASERAEGRAASALGRALLDSAVSTAVRYRNSTAGYNVNADIVRTRGFSGHTGTELSD